MSMERIGAFVLVLFIWTPGTAFVSFLAALSINEIIIGIVSTLSTICLLVAFGLLLAGKDTAAYATAAGPYLIIGAIYVLASLPGI